MITPYPDHKYGKPVGSIHVLIVLFVLLAAILLKIHSDHRVVAAGATDREFQHSLNQAITQVAAREAQLELTVSKHLDLERLREELGARHIPPEPVEPEEDKATQRLSILPR